MALRVSGPITIPSMLSRDFTDERTLALGRSPAYVVRQDHSDASAHYTVVIGAGLGCRALMDLLYTLAPYKAHGPDRFPRVLDNWRIHDRARTSSASASLLLQHANALKFSWHEFARHRDLFVRILEDQTESRRALPIVSWSKDATGRRSWRLGPPDDALSQTIAELIPGLMTSGAPQAPVPDALAGLVTIPYFLPQLRQRWPAWRPLVKDGKSNYIGPASVPVIALTHRRALLNSPFTHTAEALADSD